jgi:hypothetical protein
VNHSPWATRGRRSAPDQYLQLRDRARTAQGAGRIAEAAVLYAALAEAEPTDSEMLYEAGAFLLALNRNLAGLEALNEGHRIRFAISDEQAPIVVATQPVGRQGWELAQRCLLAASLREPKKWVWQLALAEVLERSGQPGPALQWRRNIARLQPGLRDNTVTSGRPSISVRSGQARFPTGAAELARAHARQAWSRAERIASLQCYLASVEPYKMSVIPQQYELCSDYKVLHHVDGRYYAIPRHVAEFTIIDGAVYILTGMARLSPRKLPPWVFAGALRWRAWARLAISAVPVLRPAVGRARAVALALSRTAAVRHLLQAAARVGWRRYRVQGVLVADRLEILLDLIEGARSPLPTSTRARRVPGRDELAMAMPQRGLRS